MRQDKAKKLKRLLPYLIPAIVGACGETPRENPNISSTSITLQSEILESYADDIGLPHFFGPLTVRVFHMSLQAISARSFDAIASMPALAF